MTLDGFCDHTAMIADEALHQNANELFYDADTIVFGRVTYQLMESAWPAIVQNPTGVKAVDEFAVLIDSIPKIVFSKTLKKVTWKNSTLATGNLEDEVVKLKSQPGKNIMVGGPSIIRALMARDLLDELQLCLQPIVLGNGLRLFQNIKERINLKLLKTKTLGSGVVILTYQPKKK